MLILLLLVNALTAALTFASLIVYAVVYTVWLKRATPQNIVIGGAAGAAPPVLGLGCGHQSRRSARAAAVPDHLRLDPAAFLGAGHCAAQRLRARSDIPMLPVTHGVEFTRLHVMLYTVILCLVTLLPYMTGMSGLIYLAAALVLDGRFLFQAIALKVTRRDDLPMRMFRFSISYLMWLFLALLRRSLPADHAPALKTPAP